MSESSRSEVRFVTVSEKNEAQRIDNFLLAQLKGIPKSKIYRVIRKGEVRINKKRCKPLTKLTKGDVVRIPPIYGIEGSKGPVTISESLSAFLDSAILYEDKSLLVINKPSGLAVHGGSGIRVGLIEAMRTKYSDTQFLELVHRIDKGTSGCILLAKSRATLRALHTQFRDDQVSKTYCLAVHGKWPKHRKKVDAPLKKDELKSGEHIVRVHQDGKASQTDFRVLTRANDFTFMEAKPVTGRTHQIRVHAAFTGCPLVGDEKYTRGTETEKYDAGEYRLMLHAQKIQIIMPGAPNKKASFEAPYDDTFKNNLVKMGLL